MIQLDHTWKDAHKDEGNYDAMQYRVETRNVSSMNQSQLEIIKREIEHLYIEVLGISKLKWTESGYFWSDSYKVFCSRSDKLRRNKVTLIWRKDVAPAVRSYNTRQNNQSHDWENR